MTESPPGEEGRPRIRPFLGGSPAGAPPPPSPPDPADRPSPLREPTSLRPYVLTAGRTEAVDPEIGIETQVSARPGGATAGLAPQLASIVALCAGPLSVAEISARLRLHLGVTRVLVGDLRAAGLVDVHTMDITEPHSPEIIMRVMRGLRAIS